MKKIIPILALFSFSSFTFSQSVTLDLFASGFSSSVDIQNAGDDRLFVVEQRGVIKILNADGSTNATPFLDIQSIVDFGGERGLLGLAFHPDYANNGYFYVHYSDNSGDTQISRFSVDSGNPDIADSSSELQYLNVIQPFGNHNGGSIAFGPDGYLYIALGDGGSGGDPNNYAQNTELLLGKLLRIDVDTPGGSTNYSIPPDNPFFGEPVNAEEIWSIGLRNPFRFSFDFTDNKIWIGDVGQNGREEVNSADVTEAAVNYGWRCYEGNNPYNTSNCLPSSEYRFPVYDYPWNGGGSVIGGRVYRGATYLDLQGVYIFGDIDGMLGTLDASYNFINQSAGNPNGTWVAFGADNSGEMYAVSLGGNVYKIIGGQIASIEDFNTDSFTLFPNPAKTQITIQSETEILQQISIFDINGRLVHSEKKVSGNSKTMDISSFSTGLYLVKITSENGIGSYKKFIIN
ncbi:MAG: PQQ-dependent sugar dehydrogenase [Flavobacteriaceae bacterium]|nr:PQQ-dependent sugar dehydrogenase [Flavobacteriaceae bacterium]